MNYGLLNFKTQHGKPQIFWSNEKTKKQDRKFGYKTRDQRYNIRQYPADMRTDPDNFLQPPEPPVEEKPKKPAKNFIKKNKEILAKKNKNKENEQLVTLTQDQLNAILASVGKVASGKEDALRISIDAEKHEIKVESPGREGGDGKRERRHRRKKDEDSEQSIFALVDDNKKFSRDTEEKSRRDRRDQTPDRDDSVDRYRARKHSGDRHHHRNHSNERYRDHSGDRHRKHSGERYRRDSRERGRSHSRDRRQHSSDRYRTPSRERRRHSPDDRSRERRRYSPENRSRERRRHSPEDRSRERRRHSPYDRYKRDSPSEGRHRKSTPDRADLRNEKPKEDNPPSPREIAGIPVSLPWKHMTKAERRRLMLAREKVLAEETRKEEEEKKRNYQELETKIQKNFKKDDYRRDEYQRRDDDRISDSDRGSSLKTISLPPTNGRMSLGEMKRRQWEKERADTTTAGEFQPWGKPGAGAPIRTKSGSLAADYSRRKDLLYPFVNNRN